MPVGYGAAGKRRRMVAPSTPLSRAQGLRLEHSRFTRRCGVVHNTAKSACDSVSGSVDRAWWTRGQRRRLGRRKAATEAPMIHPGRFDHEQPLRFITEAVHYALRDGARSFGGATG